MTTTTPQDLLLAEDANETGEFRSLWQDVWIQFRKHKGAMVGLVIIVIAILFCFVGPLIHTVEPQYADILARNQGPSAAHPFGTDSIGRDILAMMMSGGRVSLSVGFVAMAISVLLGAIIGILAGYFPVLDGPLMRLTDMFFALPLLPLLLVIMLLFRDTLRDMFGPETGIFIMIVVVIGSLSWMGTARIVRGEVLSVKQNEFVMAAVGIGTKPHRILFRHIFPNVLSPLMVAAALGVASAILTESALSFLGLGFPSDFPTWGRLLFEARDYINLFPSRVIWPGVAISLTVLSVNFIGDGLRDALDPRLRGR